MSEREAFQAGLGYYLGYEAAGDTTAQAGTAGVLLSLMLCDLAFTLQELEHQPAAVHQLQG